VGDSKANIIVVEDETQLEKILKFKDGMPCLKVNFLHLFEKKL